MKIKQEQKVITYTVELTEEEALLLQFILSKVYGVSENNKNVTLAEEMYFIFNAVLPKRPDYDIDKTSVGPGITFL